MTFAATVAILFPAEPGPAHAQQVTSTGGDTLYLNPVTGADTNSGAKASPLRTLAEAARRVNQSSGSGAMTIVLTEGIHAVGETTVAQTSDAGRFLARSG